jgi:rhamnose utilization protein RhaD (predicted bifunctional aldolase and dehydrogenase)
MWHQIAQRDIHCSTMTRDGMKAARGETVMTSDASLLALRRVAATIGADPALIQGAGGNVSVKCGEILWIKASGAWLAEAETRDIMAPVALPRLRAAIAADDDDAERAETFAIADRNASGLRPSIETSMHAALPHAVVLHVHSVDAIAVAVRADAGTLLEEKLAGLRWALAPYRRPGLPLTRAIAEVAPEGAADVLVLANHGLVVAAETVDAAAALLTEAVARLSSPPREAPAASPATVAAMIEGHGFRLPTDPAAHAIAADPASLAIAERGVLYPDHVVFLGAAPLVIDRNDDLGAVLDRWKAAGFPNPRWIIVRGLGIAVANDIARGGDEMARCLADVAARLPTDAPLTFLADEDIAALTDWDAEKYRQRLASAQN